MELKSFKSTDLVEMFNGEMKVIKNVEVGDGVKSIISKKIMDYGFENVTIKFLGYGKDNKKVLRYIVHTEGPIFIIDTMSNSETQPPCMEVMDVIAYTKA